MLIVTYLIWLHPCVLTRLAHLCNPSVMTSYVYSGTLVMQGRSMARVLATGLCCASSQDWAA